MTGTSPLRSGRASTERSTTTTVCIVDPRINEYREWNETASDRGVAVHHASGFRAALRLAATEQIDLWVINTELAELSGIDLCGMLRERNSRTAIYLVTEHYSVAEEQAAWRARPTMFGCQAAHAEVLDQWLSARVSQPQQSRPTAMQPVVR